MKLHDHPDFAAFITAAATERELAEQFVEKDYWITEILRVIASTLPDRAIFKGGTSLSKGWAMLDRFSEDIDLFVDPLADPALSKNGIDKTLKKLCRDIANIDGLELLSKDTIGGRGRHDTFGYDSLYPDIAGFPPTVRLEPGIQSGKQPTADVEISSFVSDLLRSQGATDSLEGIDGLEPFVMTLLHFRRTFVEKLFALHGKVESLKAEGRPLGRDARHYADVHVLAATNEVMAMLSSDEYAEIKSDYDEKSLEFFPGSYRPPPDLSFATSDAFFPPAELREKIEIDYERECGRLFYRSHPPFGEVLDRLETIRNLI